MSRNPLHQRLIQIIEPVLEAAGFELVDVRFLLEQGGWVLRVQVDIPLDQVTDITEVPSDRVDLADCEDMSRELSAVLDVEDPIANAYTLEVSSPGIDRPLTREKDYIRWAGHIARMETLEPVEGKRRFKGLLLGLENGAVRMKLEDDKETLVPLSIVSRAKLELTDALIDEHRRAQEGAEQTH